MNVGRILIKNEWNDWKKRNEWKEKIERSKSTECRELCVFNNKSLIDNGEVM